MSLLIQMAMQTVVRVADLLRFEIHLRQIPVLLFTEPLVPVLKLAAAGIVPPVDSSLKDDTSPPPCRFHGLRPLNQRGRRTSGNIHQNHVNIHQNHVNLNLFVPMLLGYTKTHNYVSEILDLIKLSLVFIN
ncbi:hypothetical protein NC653_018247 [Populus alba x Populus x berolinensis]|uniref:Uncharacterized protein n=1 Tax=Populus alba x Populus x berolinensis TaxID=444605 RepID=A0AAD6QG00_9ROSI|nr:hypothetical protein NC653_018247 [Populus alba x Populus x berolinensis]